jgi:hypothetical protein
VDRDQPPDEAGALGVRPEELRQALEALEHGQRRW